MKNNYTQNKQITNSKKKQISTASNKYISSNQHIVSPEEIIPLDSDNEF